MPLTDPAASDNVDFLQRIIPIALYAPVSFDPSVLTLSKSGIDDAIAVVLDVPNEQSGASYAARICLTRELRELAWLLDQHNSVAADVPSMSRQADFFEWATGYRAATRSALLTADVLTDTAVRCLRPIHRLSASHDHTESLSAFVKHLENGGAPWSARYLRLHEDLARLHYSLGVFRDWFVAHHRMTPLMPVVSHDGRAVGLVPDPSGPRDAASNAEGARLLASVIPSIDDAPLHPTFDERVLKAFEALPDLSDDDRRVVRRVIEQRAVVSPDVIEVASTVAQCIQSIYTVAPKVPPSKG